SQQHRRASVLQSICFMANAIHTVGIISKPRPEQVRPVLLSLLEWLRGHELKFVFDLETERILNQPGAGVVRTAFPEPLDLVLVLGGDGTLLSAARSLAGRDVPVLAVNLGNLGFLTPIAIDQMFEMLESVLAGKHEETHRRMIQADLL